MKEILKKAQEVLDGLLAAQSEVTAKKAEYDSMLTKLADKEKALNAQSQDLSAREQAVKAIENVQAALNEAKAIRLEVSEAQKNLESQAAHLAADRKKLNDAIAEAKRDAELRQKDWDLIKKDREQLKKDRENYKEEIRKKLMAGV